ncbi:hypothetical protein ACSBR1_025125 [Camellia fascicularis]
MVAFQVCLQVWLATSLLADGLAVAGQAILASAFAKKDYEQARATTSRVLQLGLVLGFVLALILGVGLQLGAKLFTNDVNVLHIISVGIPLVLGGSPDPECVVVCKIVFVSVVKLADLKKNADE